MNAINDPPVAVDDKYSTKEDTKLVVAAPGVLGNDTDVDGGTLTAIARRTCGRNRHAQFRRQLHLRARRQFQRCRLFTYTVDDGKGGTDIGQVDISVTSVNDAPVAAGQKLTTDEDTPARRQGDGHRRRWRCTDV